MLSCFGFTNRRRTSMCVSCGYMWLLVLVIVRQCGGDDRDEQHVNYTVPDLDLSYSSSTEVNAKAMEQLYYVTNFFISLIQKENGYPEGLLEDKDGRFTTEKLSSDWALLARHYAGVVSVAAVGLVFVVLMPLVALFFCCCRCAGRCGGRTQPFEKRRDPCKRVTLGIILSVVAIIVLFGVVCAFVTNEYMEDGIKNLPSKLTVAISDIHLYINNTVSEFDHLLVNNFLELKSSLQNDLIFASTDIMDQLKNRTPLAALDSLRRFGDGLRSITGDINKVESLTQELKKEAEDVNKTLTTLKNRLTTQLHQCLSNRYCNESYQQVQQMSNPADFSQFLDSYLPKLPDITDQIKDFKDVSKIESGISNGTQEYQKIQTQINDTVTKYTPDVLKALDDAGDEIKKQSKEMKNVMNNVVSVLDTDSKSVVDDFDGYIQQYSQYRYYADISVCSVMLLILLCITMGLFYGFCGKRPDSGYNEDCCNKATGSSFLMLGVYVMFIFSAVLMLVTLVHFLLGVVAEKTFCQTLRHPQGSQVLALLNKEKILNINYSVNGSSVNLDISAIISSCHANDSIYNVLQVSTVLDISEVLEYPQTFGIQKKINELKENINIPVGFQLLDNATKDSLRQLGNSSLNLTALDEVLASVDRNNTLLDIAQSLNDTADHVQLKNRDIQMSLRKDSETLRKLQEETIHLMIMKADVLNETAYALEEKMKFNYSSVSEAVNRTIDEIEKAQEHLNSDNATATMTKVVDDFINSTLEKVHGFLRRVVYGTTMHVGSCEPLSRVYNASLVATCNDVLDPFNGFWASIGWCLVLFIPAIIFSVKLASLYKKSESYHAAIPDTEYLYDAYADRDNIPLANGPDKKTHHRRYNETYDNSTGYLGDYNSHVGRSDRDRREHGGSVYHSEDARFNDMAPKYTPLGHWDYSNGALPRYHSPPHSTEYERPPPYYYPGPGKSGQR